MQLTDLGYWTPLDRHPISLEPNPLHEAIKLIERKELHSQFAGTLPSTQAEVDAGAKVLLELATKVRQVR